MNELLPCPFCGGEASLHKTEGCDYVICCTVCGGTVFDDMNWHIQSYDGEKNVIQKWNTRAPRKDE